MTQPETQPATAGGQAPQPPQERARARPGLSAERLAQLGPLIALVLVVIFFTTQSSRFFTFENFSLVFQQVMVIGTLAIGQTIIILTAGIDLSCGVVMAFGSIVMTKMAVNNGVPALIAVLLGILACLAFGVINGGFVTFLGLPPFIVTLGTYNIAFALTHIYSKDETISGLPTLLTKLGEGFSVGSARVTYGSVLCLALFLATWFALSQSAWGRHVYTLGDNPEAARLMGISVRRKLLMVYIIASAFYGIAALLLIARTNVGDPNAGQTENLEAITAVVLGGTSLFGGRGTVIGTLIGAIIIGILRNGLVLMGVASIYQVLITGILVILAVSVDQLARRRAK